MLVKGAYMTDTKVEEKKEPKLHLHYDARSDITNVCLVSRDKNNKRISLQIGSIKAYDRPKYYRHSDTFLISREPALDKDPLVKNIFQEIERLLYTVLERRYSFSLRSGRTEENQSYEEIYEALPSEYKELIGKEEQRLTQAYQETMQRALNIRKDLQSPYTQDTARFLEQIYQIAQSFK